MELDKNLDAVAPVEMGEKSKTKQFHTFHRRAYHFNVSLKHLWSSPAVF